MEEFMKKLMVFIFAAIMAVGFAGTALADTVELTTATSGVSRVYWGPVFGTATGGASAYVVGGTIADDSPVTGATLYAISNDKMNAAGTEMRAQILNSGSWWRSGATPIGGPQLISGTSDTVVVYVQASAADAVGNGTTFSGNTLYIINGGTGAAIYQLGIPNGGMIRGGGSGGVLRGADSALTPYCLAPVTIDSESVGTTAGATIYGVSGATTSAVINANAGVSIWAVSAQTGTYVTAGGVQTGLTSFVTSGPSGVSSVQAAPVISGTSLFIIGYSSAGAGNTIFQFLKNNLKAGVSVVATVNLNADKSDQWIPTPCVSGNSLIVVDNNGGVTSYYTANLTRNWTTPSRLYVGNEAISGVTAGPVTDGTYIVLCSTSSVTNYMLNNLSGGSKEWTYSFGANKTIDATPAISNGYVWVTVNDQTPGAPNSTTYRFNLASTTGNIQTVATYGKLTYASPIIANEDLWTVSYNPVVEKIAQTNIARGEAYWPQFKFYANKAGENTRAALQAVVDTATDDSGCFISTIK